MMTLRAVKFAAAIVLALGAAACSSNKDAGRRGRRFRGRGAATPGSAQDFVVNVGDRVFFETDQTDLTPTATATLDKQAQWLLALSEIHLPDRRPCGRARHPRIQLLALGPPRPERARLPRCPAASRATASAPCPTARSVRSRSATTSPAGRRTAARSPCSTQAPARNRKPQVGDGRPKPARKANRAPPQCRRGGAYVLSAICRSSDPHGNPNMLRRLIAIFALLTAFAAPALAQDAADAIVRLNRLEGQFRQISGPDRAAAVREPAAQGSAAQIPGRRGFPLSGEPWRLEAGVLATSATPLGRPVPAQPQKRSDVFDPSSAPGHRAPRCPRHDSGFAAARQARSRPTRSRVRSRISAS